MDNIIAVKQQEVAEARKTRPIEELVGAVEGLPPARDFKAGLTESACAIIAEVKRRSPSRGEIRADVDPAAIASVYEKNGAAAVSVLTDREFFGGSPADLMDVRMSVSLPVLRKDFIIDPYQIYETRLMGADAMLLIADILEQDELAGFIARAAFLGIHCLVEVHTRAALDKAMAAGAAIIGINNRDLTNFAVDLKTSLDLMPGIPMDTVVVSESAIRTRSDIEMLMGSGIHAFLVGETLMKADDIGGELRKLLGKKGGNHGSH
ncbi:MAG: indole-3-glycerol phosphate synthase TrpC [Syntrophales bacterium]|nr:indole-3-glycerol phosphate synthase TrpC [Syntrophales bacterium]